MLVPMSRDGGFLELGFRGRDKEGFGKVLFERK